MLDEQVDELVSVDETDTGKARLKCHLGGGGLVRGCCDESPLATEGNGLPKVLHDAGGNPGADRITLCLDENLHLGQIRDVEFTGRIDATIARLASDFRSLEPEGREQMADEYFELPGIEFEYLVEDNGIGVVCLRRGLARYCLADSREKLFTS